MTRAEFTCDTGSTDYAHSLIFEAMAAVEAAETAAAGALCTGSYCMFPGLGELAANHGALLNGGAGSARAVAKDLLEQCTWLADALRATVQALTGHETIAARGLEVLDEGGAVAPEAVVFPQRPALVAFGVPWQSISVTGGESFTAARINLTMADATQPRSAGMAWRSYAHCLDDARDELTMAAVLEGCEGEVFDSARVRILEVAEAAGHAADNARIMGRYVAMVEELKKDAAHEMALISSTASEVKDPQARKDLEQSLFDDFLLGPWQLSLDAAQPPVVELIRPATGGGGGDIAVGLGSTGLARTALEALRGVGTMAQSVAAMIPSPTPGVSAAPSVSPGALGTTPAAWAPPVRATRPGKVTGGVVGSGRSVAPAPVSGKSKKPAPVVDRPAPGVVSPGGIHSGRHATMAPLSRTSPDPTAQGETAGSRVQALRDALQPNAATESAGVAPVAGAGTGAGAAAAASHRTMGVPRAVPPAVAQAWLKNDQQ